MQPEQFPAAVALTITRLGLASTRPLLMVSGGPDSVAMLCAVAGAGTDPVVLHVDHGLRGEESREDARFVRDLCERLGVACEVRQVRLGGSNLQEEARKQRYRLAEEIAGEQGLSAIATGHTADDVAETVLMNLARGSGLRGLSGIPPVRGKIIRPLIERRRAEVLAYLNWLKQPYRTDATNLTPKYARNRVRLEVLPVLEELYPGAGANIARVSRLLRDDLEVLEGLVAKVVRWRGGEEVVVPLDELGPMPLALKRHAVRRAYSALVGDEASLDSAAVEGVLDLARNTDGTRTMRLAGSVTAAVRYGEELAFYRAVESFPGEIDLLAGRQGFHDWLIEVREVEGFDAGDAARPEVAYLDVGKGPYRVRMAREGDTIRPLGLGGAKKVMRAMMDRRVPSDLRRGTPVVVDSGGEVAWIFLGEIGEAYKVSTATERTWRVEVEKTR